MFKQIKNLFNQSITSKIILFLSLLVIIITVMLSHVLTIREQNIIYNKLLNKGKLLVNTLSITSKDPLIMADYPALKLFVGETSDDKEIAYIYIYDENTRQCVAYIDSKGESTYEGKSYDSFTDELSKKILNSNDLLIEQTTFNNEKIIDISKPIIESGTKYGIVRIGISQENMKKELRYTNYWILFITLFSIIVEIIFSIILAHFIILKPLQKLVKGVESVSVGDFSKKIEIESEDEFGKLSRTFNRMTSNISNLYDIARAMNFVKDTNHLLNLILDTALKTLESERGSLMLLDEEEKCLKVEVVRGLDRETEDFIKIPIGEGVAGEVFVKGESLIINEGFKDQRFKIFRPDSESEKSINTLLCAPLKDDNKVIGVINIVNKKNGEKFDENDNKILNVLSNHAAITLSKAKLYEDSITDGLTKLYIHRYFQARLEEEIHRSDRYNYELSLLMIDIDYFKKINDTYGHQLGDSVLFYTAKLIKESIRDNVDIACRYGGEELAVILPQSDSQGAKVLAERLRIKIEKYEYPVVTVKPLHITVSIGIATYPTDATKKDYLIKAADDALYKAKSLGRNRTVSAQECQYLIELESQLSQKG